MAAIMAELCRWLVDHPTIATFEWSPGHTFASTPTFLAAAVVLYLTFTLLLHRFNLLLPAALLRPISATHNLLLLSLSLFMAAGCSLSAAGALPRRRHLFCFPIPTPPAGPLFFYAYVFYLSKLLEFSDTLLILLGPTRRRRLSFLHVYHHATVVVMSYLWLDHSQSLFPVALVTNAVVHVVMYGYYFLCSVGCRPAWKRAVTDLQIVQFVFSFAVSVVLLWMQFVDTEGEGCSGMGAWCFNALFNASLLGLFINFHLQNYRSAKASKQGKLKAG